MRPFPGPVADLCGIEVEDFTRIAPSHKEPSLRWEEGERGETRFSSGPFNDILRPISPETQILARYDADAGYYAGQPALAKNLWGTGSAYYYGGVFTPAVADALVDTLGLTAPFADLLTLPRDVELAVRRQPGGGALIFLLNYSSSPQPIVVHQETRELLSGTTIHGEQNLPPFGVWVLSSGML